LTPGQPSDIIHTQQLASSVVDRESMKSIQYIPDQASGLGTIQNNRPNVAILSGTQNMNNENQVDQQIYVDMETATNPTHRRQGNRVSSRGSPSKSVELNMNKDGQNDSLQPFPQVNDQNDQAKLEIVGSEATKSMDYAS
jgi:hypothetical protein